MKSITKPASVKLVSDDAVRERAMQTLELIDHYSIDFCQPGNDGTNALRVTPVQYQAAIKAVRDVLGKNAKFETKSPNGWAKERAKLIRDIAIIPKGSLQIGRAKN